MQNYYLAIDIGASSGRHILGHLQDGKMVLEEIGRFDNRQVMRNGHICWDMDNIREGILEGLKNCGKLGKIPSTIAIDTWGVDYVLLDQNKEMLSDAVAYRDSRTDGIAEEAEMLISQKELYQRTGIQKISFNTIYQLIALKKEQPEALKEARSLLMIPDYLNYLLTGVMKQEYTNATTTGLVNAREKTWDMDLIRTLGLPEDLFGELSMPGTIVGPLKPEIAELVGFNSTVILPATHDTGSAFLAVPAKDDKAAYLSSGTWSLLGMENEQPVTSEASREQNFSNEGGAWYRFRYLKNIMGLWMIQSIRRELNGVEYVSGKTSRHADGRKWSFPDLIEEAKKAEGFSSVVDANDKSFLAPDSMIDAIRAYCEKTGQPAPQSVGEIMQCVYRSLAICYRDAIHALEQLTGKTLTSINIVGGGCQDNYLNAITAKMTGLPVYAGPIEGTAIGNLLVQMIAGGELKDLQEARDAIRRSFAVREIQPGQNG